MSDENAPKTAQNIEVLATVKHSLAYEPIGMVVSTVRQIAEEQVVEAIYGDLRKLNPNLSLTAAGHMPGSKRYIQALLMESVGSLGLVAVCDEAFTQNSQPYWRVGLATGPEDKEPFVVASFDRVTAWAGALTLAQDARRRKGSLLITV